jgi:hypothetical protein
LPRIFRCFQMTVVQRPQLTVPTYNIEATSGICYSAVTTLCCIAQTGSMVNAPLLSSGMPFPCNGSTCRPWECGSTFLYADSGGQPVPSAHAPPVTAGPRSTTEGPIFGRNCDWSPDCYHTALQEPGFSFALLHLGRFCIMVAIDCLILNEEVLSS